MQVEMFHMSLERHRAVSLCYTSTDAVLLYVTHLVVSPKMSTKSKPKKAKSNQEKKSKNDTESGKQTKTSTQLKNFEEIQKRNIEAAKKHADKYESSSEEELESDSLLESVFKSYGGDRSQLQKTQEFLENVFQSGTATCLICIASVKRTDYVSLSTTSG